VVFLWALRFPPPSKCDKSWLAWQVGVEKEDLDRMMK
jgi:hypothetical protein